MTWLREPNAEPIPGYRLIEPLGSGGFGEVWKCEAPGGLFKAIKFVYGNLDSLDVDGVRAEQEWKALQRIKEVRHPFICSLERIEKVGGELVVVMELAERTLHDLFEECKAAGQWGIPRDDLLRYMGDAAEALDFLHEEYNLQHLDIKPRNLFLSGYHSKVADFGLVKRFGTESSSGIMGGVTPLYAAPETFRGKISKHTDQYSLAIVYQELLTGQRPFAGKNVRQLAQQHVNEAPDVRFLPETDRALVSKALAKNPEERFDSCMEFIVALKKARLAQRIPERAAAETANAQVLVGAGKAQRSRTMAESMDDFQLPSEEESRDNGLDFDRPPPEAAPAGMEVSEMGVTIPQPETGALRPTLIIGLGSFGRKALLELRCRFIDRFSDLGKLPLVHFLYLDPDPEIARAGERGAPEVALSRNEMFPLPLQAVVNYRRRSLEQLNDWLPREKLYGMPRSLQTQGSRALGRLAFAENTQRLMARLKREIEEITNGDVLYQSVTQSGLALRDNTPRIYVLAAAGGGASGMLPDLGYALKRLLGQSRHPDSLVNLFLMAGAPGDPATPKAELANTYATLTELNHFSDGSISFAAQYGAEGQRLVDPGAPYNTLYLVPLSHRTPDSLQESVARLGNYLFHELTTPLGLRLDHLRHAQELEKSAPPAGLLAAPFRSFGTYAVWFPRGLLLHIAARHACRRLIEEWTAAGDDSMSERAKEELQELISKTVNDPGWQTDALMGRIEACTQAGSALEAGKNPGEVLAGILAKLEEQSLQPVAQEDPGNWAKQALTRIREWVGAGGEADHEINDWRKTRLTRSLGVAAQKIAEEQDRQLSKKLLALMEKPGARIARAENAYLQLQKYFVKAAESQKEKINQQAGKAGQAWKAVEQALEECLTKGAGFRLFGSRSRTRQLRDFLDQLGQFARSRLAEEVAAAVRHAHVALAGRLQERARDLSFCRQRLRYLHDHLESTAEDHEEGLLETRAGAEYTLTRSPLASAQSFWEMVRQSGTARVVLPEGEKDLERSALRFLQSIEAEHWALLDKELHEMVLAPRGGLQGACMHGGDLTRQLALPLLEETSRILGQYLPLMDVAQIISNECQQGAISNADLAQRTREYLDRAAPRVAGKLENHHHAFLLIPASPAGKVLGDAVGENYPEIKQVRVLGQSDLMFCREQSCLTAHDLQRWLKPCRAAYEASASLPTTSAHARFDILDWLPLDP